MIEHHTLRSDEDVLTLARTVASAHPRCVLAYDTETGASPEARRVFGEDAPLHPYAGAYLTGISVCVVPPGADPTQSAVGYYVPVGHHVGNASHRATQGLCEALSASAAQHVLHHACFDWAVLEQSDKGYKLLEPAFDTEVAHWLYDENLPKALKVLGEMYLDEDAGREQRELHAALAAPYDKITPARQAVLTAYPELGYRKPKGKILRPNAEAEAMAQQLTKKRSWGDLTVGELGPYAARDATLTAGLHAFLTNPENQFITNQAACDREMDLQRVLFDMTKRGVLVDCDILDKNATLYDERADTIAAEYEEAYGAACRQYFGKKRGDINLGSADQMRWLLYEHEGLPIRLRTDSGEASTDKNALEMLEGNRVAAGVLAYRRARKAAGSYCRPFMRFSEWSFDGRVHGHYSSTRTVTGRLSASGPNVMTLPREDTLPELRPAFYKVAPGFERVGFDINSAELWVTASITKDPVLTAALQEGRNLHQEMSKRVFGTDDKKSRFYTLSKNVNYGIEYGAGIDQITLFAAKAGFGPDEALRVARRARDGHQEMFARQHFVSEFLAEAARERGELPLHVPGRYRHFWSPGANIGYYTALNALVQGGVSEYMKDMMLELRATDWIDFLILQVHDELVFDAPIGSSAAILATLTEISERINPFEYVLTWDAKKWSADAD